MNDVTIFEKPCEVMADRVFYQNKRAGWWIDFDRPIKQLLQLVSSEICEATEAFRKDLMDDKLPHHKGEYVELADTAIRLYDISGRYNMTFPLTDIPVTIPSYICPSELHWWITESLVEFKRKVFPFDRQPAIDYRSELAGREVKKLLTRIYAVAEERGCDNFAQIIEEKIEFNTLRKDHQLSERRKKNGKKI